MAQEQSSKEPTVQFTVKAGLPQSPQVREVEVPQGDLRPWDLDTLPKFRQMGKRHPRIEAPLKVTGRARYARDVKLPGMLFGRMVGATVPAGEIVSLDTSQAEALPGVRAVWTADAKIIRFAGQDVAAVAALSPQIAEDAARLIRVTYKQAPFTRELREAMKADAPLVYGEADRPGGKDVPHQGNIVGPGIRRGAAVPRGDLDKG